MRYSTAALRLLAVQDVLTGPGRTCTASRHQAEGPGRAATGVQRRSGCCGHRGLPAAPRQATGAEQGSHDADRQGGHLEAGVRRNAASAPSAAAGREQATADGRALPRRVLVDAGQARQRPGVCPDGATTAWYQRDRRLFRTLGLRSLRAHLRLRRQWPALAAEYRAAAAYITSPQQWRQTISANSGEERGDQ